MNNNNNTKIAVMLKKKQMLTLTEWYDDNCFTCFQGEPDDPTGSKAMEQQIILRDFTRHFGRIRTSL